MGMFTFILLIKAMVALLSDRSVIDFLESAGAQRSTATTIANLLLLQLTWIRDRYTSSSFFRDTYNLNLISNLSTNTCVGPRVFSIAMDIPIL